MPASTPHARRATHRYFLVMLAVGMGSGLLGPALPHLAAMTGSTMGQISVLFTARALGNMLGSLLSGRLVDRFPGHRVVAAMLLMALVGLLALALFVLRARVARTSGGSSASTPEGA
ncbi:MFS transporter [Halomonas sp. ATCH28]|uniref:MFS transporter n=1 Tax=Halomonas gemina TaxID=2945105 RepID=A0ABT0T4N8_9GAMM|nr:MFS transporter [Halomonas gemina]MCL7941847.1 MFS transporter [Halomonas gemina]